MVSIVIYGVPGEVGYHKTFEAKDLTPSEIHYYIGTYWCGYSALLMDIIEGKELIRCGEGLDSYEIDKALNQLSRNQRAALCAYYGLMGHGRCDTLNSVAFVVQRVNSHDKGYEVWRIRDLLKEALKVMSLDPRVQRVIRVHTEGRFFPESES